MSQTPNSAAPAPPFASNLVLVGFMGSGKSSIGRILALKLGRPLIDTDAMVVEAAGMQITEIFAKHGEDAFRRYESQVLGWLLERNTQPMVIATGGGIVTQPENLPLLHQLGFVVGLTATEEVLFDRVSRNKNRPLLHTPNPRETLSQLLALRAPLYDAAADFIVETSAKSHAQVADEIIAEAARRCLG